MGLGDSRHLFSNQWLFISPYALSLSLYVHTHTHIHTHTHKFMHTHTHTQHTHIFVLCVCASICMFCVHILASVLPKVNVLFGLVKMFSGVMEQVARHTPNCRRHYVILAVAEILFVFNFLVTHWLHPHHQISFPISPSCIPSPHSSLPLDFFHHLCQAHWTCGCLHGVKLHYASGHVHWPWFLHDYFIWQKE